MCTYEPYFKYKRGVIVIQNRHRTSAYFGSAVQVQRKSILSTGLLLYPPPPPTWVDYNYRPCSLAKQGENVLGSVHLSVSPLTAEPSDGVSLYSTVYTLVNLALSLSFCLARSS